MFGGGQHEPARRSRRYSLPLLLAALALTAMLAIAGRAGSGPTFQEIEEALTCQCGCGLTVHSCNHLQCPSAIPLRQEINAQIGRGLDRTAILAYFSDKYGEKILSAPTTSGFNITAWVLPFVAVALGAGVVVVTLLRWRRSSAALAAPVSALRPVPETKASPYDQILDRELEDFDR